MGQSYFGSNIPVAAGFDLNSQRPLDARTVVDNYSDLLSIPDIQKYAGLSVYVKENTTVYTFNGDNWIESSNVKYIESIGIKLDTYVSTNNYTNGITITDSNLSKLSVGDVILSPMNRSYEYTGSGKFTVKFNNSDISIVNSTKVIDLVDCLENQSLGLAETVEWPLSVILDTALHSIIKPLDLILCDANLSDSELSYKTLKLVFRYIGNSKATLEYTMSDGSRARNTLRCGTAMTGTGEKTNTGVETYDHEDIYFNTSTGEFYNSRTLGTKKTATWYYAGNIKGTKGSSVHASNVAITDNSTVNKTNLTSNDVVQVGDLIIDNGGLLYSVVSTGSTTATVGTKISSIKGLKGDTGSQGPVGAQGATGPQGAKGDKGDTGAQGAKGDKGDTGTRGSLWYSGTVITGTATSNTVFSGSGITSALVEDRYLNTSTGYTYRCTTAGAASAATWVYTGSIKGATGAQGATGPQGAKGETGAQGAKGDTGAQGATGPQGAKGDKGDTGTRGSYWYVGTGITGTATTGTIFAGSGLTSALVNDMYLNSSTGNAYICTTAGNAATAKWVYSGNIKGPQGATGAQGATGPQGAKGETGAQGPKGDKGDKGDAFAIAKTYASVAAMNADFSNASITQGQFVLIETGNVNDEDNSKLYVKGATAFSFVTDLSGAQGIKGDKGDTGAQGAKGDKGDTGTRGSLWYAGTALTGTATTNTAFTSSGIASALVNDMYLNTSTGGTYRCTVAGNATNARWVYAGSIKGATGATGAQGATGPQGAKGDTGAQGIQGVKGDTGAQGIQGVKGDTGTRGSMWYRGTGVTGTSTTGTVFSGSGVTSALVNDMYLNTSTSGVYQCTTAGAASVAKWAYIGSIKGATGATGAQGATGPQGAKGDKGDTGETGAKGDKGDTGATGTRGTLWYSGTALTGTATTNTAFTSSGITSALVNDMYLNTSTGGTYRCTVAGNATNARWVYAGSIKGATGATGATGPQGAKGETGAQGAKGETGATGPTGPQGATGATGVRGSMWYQSTAVTGTSTTGTIFSGSGITSALVNDMNLNPSTGNLYKCTTAGAASVAKWTYVGSIKGATGATGATGPQGPQGPAGKDAAIKLGSSYATAQDAIIFFKTV